MRYTNGSPASHNHSVTFWNLVQDEKIQAAVEIEANKKRKAKSIAKEQYVSNTSNRLSTTEKKIRKEIRGHKKEKCFEDIQIEEKDKMFIIEFSSDLILLGDPQLFSLCETTKMIFTDGTWKIAPTPLFKQLYSIHCLKGGAVFPVFYALLKGKSKKVYKKLFDVIKKKTGIDILNTKAIVMSDFEICGFNFFPKSVQRKCCLFHFCQSLYRRCQVLGKEEYAQKGEFYELARSLMMLPLVKEERIESIIKFFEGKYKSELDKKFLEYFKSNYLFGRYKVSQWNLMDVPVRTNNWLESLHSMLN